MYQNVCVMNSECFGEYALQVNMLIIQSKGSSILISFNNSILCSVVSGSTEIDECEADPCVAGLCVDKVDGYECRCDEGFTGTNCDTRTCSRLH